MLFAVMQWPETALGWLTLVAIVLGLCSTIIGLIYGALRFFIQAKVAQMVEAAVTEQLAEAIGVQVAAALQPTNEKIDGLRINQLAISEGLGQVAVVEAKLENGVKKRLDNLETMMQVLVGNHLPEA